ncbi:hypothetical protein [Methylobacterium sp. 1973]|uniref:hypothetical protein n=1 Tax=Methylobacterium sp. 1973 TaxID=3156421 RepID=UPI0033960A45
MTQGLKRASQAEARTQMLTRMPLGFKLWFAFVGIVMLSIFIGIGVLAYRISTEPKATGEFIGRIISGAINGAQRDQP